MALTLLAVETEFSDGPIGDTGLFNNSTVYRFEAQMNSRVAAQNVLFHLKEDALSSASSATY
ncbi:hypothetical protein [Bradyrhizobium sp. STM 3557]|uniref:hypothetical protein n=1 Tax=Bradyrhizobium sp. STM 3557 TaxID=578920 RepID=UPI00388E49BD